jgi:CDP-diacylglycerol--glycerol-3-phosphate 3-phosphatidyltransferase
MRDVDWSYGIAGLLFSFVSVYSTRTLLRGRARNPRVDKDGGSLLVAKGFLEFGYWLMEPVAWILFRLRVTPDQVTAFSLLPAFAAGVAVAGGRFGLACFLSTAASLCDTLDGLIARRAGTASDAGEVFDAMADRYVEFFFIGGLVIHYRSSLPLCVLALASLLGAFLISYSTAKAEAIGVPAPRGLMRRAERAIYLAVAAGLTPIMAELGGPALPMWLSELPIILVLGLIGGIANASAVFRLRTIMASVRARDASRPPAPLALAVASTAPGPIGVSRLGDAVTDSLSGSLSDSLSDSLSLADRKTQGSVV